MLTFEVFNERQQRARSYRDEVASLVFDFLFLTISANRNALIKYRSRKEDTYIIAANIKRRSAPAWRDTASAGIWHWPLSRIRDEKWEYNVGLLANSFYWDRTHLAIEGARSYLWLVPFFSYLSHKRRRNKPERNLRMIEVSLAIKLWYRIIIDYYTATLCCIIMQS